MIHHARRSFASLLDDRNVHGAQVDGHQPAAEQQQSGVGDAKRKPQPPARYSLHAEIIKFLQTMRGLDGGLRQVVKPSVTTWTFFGISHQKNIFLASLTFI